MELSPGSNLGRGSTAIVSLAIVNNTLVAAKKSSPTSLLQHEESILKQLQDCPKIISCVGRGTDALYLEYIPGGSIADELARNNGPLPESRIRSYTRSILQGLSCLHRRGYVHCDVKPQNILVTGEGDVKIADFGLAKRKGAERAYFVAGTPLYMSPESVVRGECEPPMDVWAVGCVVAEMAAGRPVRRRANNKEEDGVWGLMMRIGFDEILLPEMLLSEEGRDFLRRCFVRDSGKRWMADMLLEHPFVEGGGRCFHLDSPKSVLGLSRMDDDDDESSTECGEELDLVVAAKARIGGLSTGELPDWGMCEGWIAVRR